MPILRIFERHENKNGTKNQHEKQEIQTIQDVFDLFVTSGTADGVSETTLKTYKNHFHNISLHLDVTQPLSDLTKRDLEAMILYNLPQANWQSKPSSPIQKTDIHSGICFLSFQLPESMLS